MCRRECNKETESWKEKKPNPKSPSENVYAGCMRICWFFFNIIIVRIKHLP